MSFEQINQQVNPGHQEKGGLWGSIVGGLAGLGVGLLTLNPGAGFAAGAAAAGGLAGAGSALGGLAGNIGDPSTAPKTSKPIPTDQSAPPDKMPIDQFQDHPELQLASIADARAALPQANLSQPEYQQYSDLLNNAHSALSQRLGIGGQG